jgi:coenzyme F420 hydrogenase subunit beta
VKLTEKNAVVYGLNTVIIRKKPLEEPARGTGQKELVEEVLDAGLCTGCGACVGLCPYQAIHGDSTVALHRCDIKTGRCWAFCPRTKADFTALRRYAAPDADWAESLGPVRGFYLCRARDAANRKAGQHGGTVTALVQLALREGLITAAVLTGPGERLLPSALTVTDPAKVPETGKSRFVVSPVLAEFNRAAREGTGLIGLVATPCQALSVAKRRMAGRSLEDRAVDRLGLVVGLFCGWALSWRGLAGLLAGRLNPDAISAMDIPPSKYHRLEISAQGTPLHIPLDEVLPIVRRSCLSCDDMTAEYADLSVGSARLPEGWDEARQWNQMIVRTPRGEELVELARRRGTLEFREAPEGNLERLKNASLKKKQAAREADTKRP